MAGSKLGQHELFAVIASEAKQSSRAAKRFWIASSLPLLAMTTGSNRRVDPQLPPPQPSPARGEGAEVTTPSPADWRDSPAARRD